MQNLGRNRLLLSNRFRLIEIGFADLYYQLKIEFDEAFDYFVAVTLHEFTETVIDRFCDLVFVFALPIEIIKQL
jgi:predicted RNA-binding protein associated with RNAse of E/G family